MSHSPRAVHNFFRAHLVFEDLFYAFVNVVRLPVFDVVIKPALMPRSQHERGVSHPTLNSLPPHCPGKANLVHSDFI